MLLIVMFVVFQEELCGYVLQTLIMTQRWLRNTSFDCIQVVDGTLLMINTVVHHLCLLF